MRGFGKLVFFLIIFLIFISGCISDHNNTQIDPIIGVWEKDVSSLKYPNVTYILNFFDNGTFYSEFLNYELKSEGKWIKISDNQYVINYKNEQKNSDTFFYDPESDTIYDMSVPEIIIPRKTYYASKTGVISTSTPIPSKSPTITPTKIQIKTPIPTMSPTKLPTTELIKKMSITDHYGELSNSGRFYKVTATVKNVGNTPGCAECEVQFYDINGKTLGLKEYYTTANYISPGQFGHCNIMCSTDSKCKSVGKYTINVKFKLC